MNYYYRLQRYEEFNIVKEYFEMSMSFTNLCIFSIFAYFSFIFNELKNVLISLISLML